MAPYHTFALNSKAKLFATCSSTEEIFEYLNDKKVAAKPLFILGGGSNVVFTKNFDGVILKPKIHGIEKIQENDDHVFLRASAGENWDNFVAYAVDHNCAGIENLSYIPGSVGAVPIQNIGAYGVEVKDSIERVEGIDMAQKESVTFSNKECSFSYRSSIFKEALSNKIIITHVTFRLSKKPRLITHYPLVSDELKNYDTFSIKTLRQAIIAIRKRKLPDPKEIPNAGSFFKNPILPKEKSLALKNNYPLLPIYSYTATLDKVSAAWLIEQCGFKGKRQGNIGVSDKHALVLVNYGNGKGEDLIKLVKNIETSVEQKFGIVLVPEVIIQ
jgi:UDP-N-acetylmuramate dehydrogenase